ncbi:MAG: TM2 domain-containing protein [Pseudomonadota bacterium]
MPSNHKNKTLATLLALVGGVVGAHRFYLGGARDRWGWLHLASVAVAAMVAVLAPAQNPFFKVLPLLVSGIAACIEALVIGLLADDKWDAAHNAGSGRQSRSSWPLAVLLVATLMGGAVLVIATIARLFDLLYTGGAYG